LEAEGIGEALEKWIMCKIFKRFVHANCVS